MKTYKILSLLFLPFLVSCSEDVTSESSVTGQSEFTLTCELPPSIRSRGADANGMFGDGKDATKLIYCITKRIVNGSEFNDEIVYGTRKAGSPVPIYNGDGTFTLKFSLTKTIEDESLTGAYCLTAWADGFGDEANSPFKHYWYDNNFKAGTDVFSKDFSKSFGTYDKSDAFLTATPYIICGLDFSPGRTDAVKLVRPTLSQVCIVTPEFNDKPEGYESAYNMHFVELTDQNEEGKYCYTNGSGLSGIKRQDNYYLPVEKNIVPTSERITINGKEMRYLYMDYLYISKDKEYGLYVNGEVYPVDLGITMDQSVRIIIYPKGSGFYNETKNFEFTIITDSKFASDKEYEI